MNRTLVACITLIVASGAAMACKSSDKKHASSSAASGGKAGSSSIDDAGDAGEDSGPSEGGAGAGSATGGADSSGGSGSDRGGRGSTSGTGGMGVDPDVTTPTSCADVGSLACARLEQCSPFLMEAYYGDRAACQTLFADNCTGLAEAKRSVDFAACGAALASCGSFVEAGGVPAWCWAARGVANLRGACTTDLDCAEGFCERAKGEAAGACAIGAAEGESCAAPLRCGFGLRCRVPDYVCSRPLPDGDACESPFQCQLGSTCTADQVCARMAIGDRCAAGVLPCDSGRGQTCLLDACAEVRWADETRSCLNTNVECPGTQRCVVHQTANLERTGACGSSAGLAESCDADSPCIEPFTCRAGVCKP
jgi:hypothetical protein